jgi:hypothetical protein
LFKATLSSQKSNLLSRISKIENRKMLFTIETFLNTLEDNSIIITSEAEKKLSKMELTLSKMGIFIHNLK